MRLFCTAFLFVGLVTSAHANEIADRAWMRWKRVDPKKISKIQTDLENHKKISQKKWVALLSQPSYEYQKQGRESLTALPEDEKIPLFQYLLNHRSTSVRLNTARILHTITDRKQAEAFFEKAMKDPKIAVQKNAFLAFDDYLENSSFPMSSLLETKSGRTVFSAYFVNDYRYGGLGQKLPSILLDQKWQTIFTECFSKFETIKNEIDAQNFLFRSFIYFAKVANLHTSQIDLMFAQAAPHLYQIDQGGYSQFKFGLFRLLASPSDQSYEIGMTFLNQFYRTYGLVKTKEYLATLHTQSEYFQTKLLTRIRSTFEPTEMNLLIQEVLSSLQKRKKDQHTTPSSVSSDSMELRLDQNDGPFQHISVTHQASGDCYAEAAANLVDAYRFTHLNLEPDSDQPYSFHTSPEWLAIETKREFIRSKSNLKYDQPSFFFDGGSIASAINTLRKKGACNRNENPDSFLGFGSIEKIKYLEIAYRYYHEKQKRYHGKKSFDSNDLIENISYKYSYNEDEKRFLQSIDKTGKSLTLDQFLLSQGCAEKDRRKFPHIPAPLVIHLSDSTPSIVNSTLQKVTEKALPASQPIGIAYCASNLFTNSEISKYSRLSDKKCEPHASSIIGQRYRFGRRQLLLQNSWGTQCESLKLRYADHVDCENGRLWIDQTILSQQVLSLTYIPYE
jgi:hypothetical protein